MRRGSWLVVIAISLAACGLDVVGLSPSSTTPLIEGGSTSSSSSSGSSTSSSSSGSTTDGDVPIDGAGPKPPFDAGAAEIVLDNVQNLTAIAIANNRLVVGRNDTDTLTLDLGPGGKMGTIPKIIKARALLADGDDVYFVAELDDNSGNVGHWKADGTDNGTTHSNEPPGRDIFLEGNLAFGSYKTRVVSYSLDLNNPQNRSDNSGTPMGVVATASDVYWADDARGTVFKDSRVLVDGPSVVKDTLDHPSTLTVSGLNVYVATISTIARVNPSFEILASSLSKPMSLTNDAGTLYWIDASTGFLKRQKLGASVDTIGTLAPFAEFRPKLIDFKDSDVYWGSPNEGRVYRRKK